MGLRPAWAATLRAAATTMVFMVTAARADGIEIAVPAPLQGPRADMGLAVHTAAAIAVAELNAAGGINGWPIVLTLHDDPCASGRSEALVRDIAATAAVAVIGHACAPTAFAAAPAYQAAGKVFIAAGMTSARPLPGALRLPPRTAQGDALAAMVPSGTPRRVALVRDKTQWHTALAQETEAALKAAGHTVVIETFTGGDKDFSALARRVVASAATDVVLLAFAVEAALIAADLLRAHGELDLIGPDQLATSDFPALAGPTVLARLRILMPPSVDQYAARHPRAAALRERLLAVGVAPSREAFETVAAIEAFVAAARAAPPGAVVSLREPRDTGLGSLTFDRAGDASLPALIPMRWRDGAWRPTP